MINVVYSVINVQSAVPGSQIRFRMVDATCVPASLKTEEETNFLSNYQHNQFQETTHDLYKMAISKRKCLAQTYKTCSLSNAEDANDIVDKRLNEITNLVDDQSGINNYASTIQNLTANLNKIECFQWKNELKFSEFEDLINSLKCCTKNQPTANELQLLKSQQMSSSRISQTNFENDNLYNVSSRNFLKPSIQKRPVDIPCNLTENIQQASKRNNFGVFKTARDEFDAQNAKKYGNNRINSDANNKQQSTNFYGNGQKKSLGSRRGVQSKFIPPVRNDGECYSSSTKPNSNDSETAMWQNEEDQDECLKNIEPRMIELIRSEIMDRSVPIAWDDIAGLEFAKTIIKEVVVWPLLRPDIFTGLRRPPKGILLFGPPGTGKTLIGKCIASQSESTFFSISASSLTSKWIGDGEKMVRALFVVAKYHQPAVIFIDEIDSLLSQRSETEHESSRRIKTEFLVQLDGATTGDEDRILVVGATNRPQELDEAARRRFVKRLYIPLPEKLARLEIVRRLMSNERNELTESNVNDISELSEGYSGADMKNLCAEASLGPIRSIDISMIQNIQADQVRPITMDDFQAALIRVRASVSSKDLEQYIVWDKTYGAGGW